MAARKLKLSDFTDTGKRITEISSRGLITSREDSRLFEVLSLMLSKKLRKIPVVDEGELIGLVTERDIVDALL